MSRKTYDKEFKISAVKLVLDSGKSVDTVAKDLGISSNSLFNWKKQYMQDAQNAFPGKGRLRPDEEELRKKDKEIAMLKMERDILKKAIAYFAKVKE
jgi:transposase